MSDYLALDSAPLSNQTSTKPAPRSGFRAAFVAVMEALVAAHSSRGNDTEQVQYRYPAF